MTAPGYIVAVLGACGGLAFAQVLAPGSEAEAEQNQISAARQERTAQLDERARRCETTFAVTQCLANVRLERLAMDAMLDRRERALKDVRRETQAREQLERVRQKEEEHALKLAAAGRKEGISQVEKPMKAPLAPAALRAPQSPQKPVLSELQREVKLQEFVKKQQAAHDKRIAVNARIKERDKPSVPLPRPP